MNRYQQNIVVVSALVTLAATVCAQEAPGQAKLGNRFPNLTLTTETGAEKRFADIISDKVVIINFMYTECDELCEKVTKNLQQVQRSLGPRLGKDVVIYSITLDPTTDTPQVLKAYRDSRDTKKGWNYFTGEVGDIAALRQGLGMSPLSPELRQKLDLAPLDSAKPLERQHSGMLLIGSDRVGARGEWLKVDALSRPDHILQIVEKLIARSAVAIPASDRAAKTIEAKDGDVWQPDTQDVVVGDVIEWVMNDNSGAADPEFPGHGVRITNWDAVKNHLEVETVPGQQPFDATTGKNDDESKTVGQVLLRLKIKSVPPAPGEIRYNCTFHGIAMTGKVRVVASAVETSKTIEAKDGDVWQPDTQDVVVGDVIEWVMNDNSGAADPEFPGHGVRITNWDAVKNHLEVETVPGQQPFDATTGKNDDESKTVGQVLLRLKIKSVPPAPGEIRYNCTFHGIAMTGKVRVARLPPELQEDKTH